MSRNNSGEDCDSLDVIVLAPQWQLNAPQHELDAPELDRHAAEPTHTWQRLTEIQKKEGS